MKQVKDMKDCKKRLQQFITTSELMEIARVHPATAYLWRTTGKIKPLFRLGNVHLYDREKVIEFINKRERKIKRQRKKYWGM